MRTLALILALSIPCFPQAWSGILDSSRATDWSTVPWVIPSYSTPCSTQPSLTAGSGNAAANTTAIQNAITSCNGSTTNVVNLPSGTYYINGFGNTAKSNYVVRGAGPNSTYLFSIGGVGCNLTSGNPNICFQPTAAQYSGSANVYAGGDHYCDWTAGFSQGATSITLNNCGYTPTIGQIVDLDQKDDASDNGGIWICSSFNSGPPYCQLNSQGSGANADGRVAGGNQFSQQQETLITGVSGSGTGPFTVTISPGVYFNNVRIGQTPGAWIPATTPITHVGVENLTIDYSGNTTNHYGIAFTGCYECWMKNVRSIDGLVDHVIGISDLQLQIRDSYFYGNQGSGSESYCIQGLETSGMLVENNIIQSTTSPDIKDAVTGSVTAYNFTPFIQFGTYLQGLYASHNSGSAFNLAEGNSTTDFIGDNVWGTSDLITIFRNQATGWQPGYTNQTMPIILNNGVRASNIIGNVLGQPSYHTQYEVYPTGASTVVHTLVAGGSTTGGAGTPTQSIYEIGTVDSAGFGNCAGNVNCDPVAHNSLMRWGNYDTVQAAVTWNSTESSPGAITYVNAQSTPGSHTLPSSFYLGSKPSWFRGVAYPPYGPDVTSGTTGICVGGTYAGLEATSSGQCTGGTFTAHAWGGFANVNPAQDCYLNVMNGPPDGSGSVLSFDANTCYAGNTGNPPASTGAFFTMLHDLPAIFARLR